MHANNWKLKREIQKKAEYISMILFYYFKT